MFVGFGIAIAACVLVMLVVGALHYGALPARHGNLTPGHLTSLITALLNQGYSGGTLTFQVRKRDAFLQMMKYVGRKRSGIQLDFPLARWSENYYDRARTVLAARGIGFVEENTGRTDTKSFLTVDFGTDVSVATRVVRLLAGEVLGVDMEHDMVAYFQNVSRNPNDRIGLR